MSANINFNKARGTNSFMSRKEIPWHGLGTIIDHAATTEEAIKLCNADFEVGLAPIYAGVKQNTWAEVKELETVIRTKDRDVSEFQVGKKVPNAFATYRKDNLHVFGLVGARYEVIQNIKAFEFIDKIIETGEAVIETAGVLDDGEKIFVTAKLPDYITLDGKDDRIESYLFITTTHDGSGMVTAALSRIRIVCNNTLDMALRDCTNKIAFRHTKNVQDKLDQGRKLMGLNNKFSKEFEQVMLSLKTKEVDDLQIANLLFQLVLTPEEITLVDKANGVIAKVQEISTRKKNTIGDMAFSIDGGPGQNLYRGTGLWLYNGITTYLNNTKRYSSPTDRLIALTEGTESKLRQGAFNLITQMV